MIDQFYSDPLSLQRLRFGPLGLYIDGLLSISGSEAMQERPPDVRSGGGQLKPLAWEKTAWSGGLE